MNIDERVTVRLYTSDLLNLELATTALAEFYPGYRRPIKSDVIRTGLAVLELLAKQGRLGEFVCGNSE